MPLQIPTIDNRRYQDLLNEALARIPVHNPEWTNFNKSDPGVTLIELFAFLTENLLYRSNQIPERNRRKFLRFFRVGSIGEYRVDRRRRQRLRRSRARLRRRRLLGRRGAPLRRRRLLRQNRPQCEQQAG